VQQFLKSSASGPARVTGVFGGRSPIGRFFAFLDNFQVCSKDWQGERFGQTAMSTGNCERTAMSTGNCNDSGLKRHQPVTVVSPKVAQWASATVITMAILSFLSVYWICPKYFVEDAERSVHGGALGTVDVVQRGRNLP
jgi:hypothetical protein